MQRTYHDEIPYLTKEKYSNIQQDLSENGWFCTVCGSHTTPDADGRGVEYGHAGDCPHRPSWFPQSAGTSQSGPNPWCEYCGRGFRNRRAVESHITRVHEYDPRAVECTICNEEFKSQQAMRAHRTQKHGKESSLPSCEVCGDPCNTYDSKYCSTTCFGKAKQTEKEMKTCPQCGDEFENPVWGKTYCSESCADEAKKAERDSHCIYCGGIIDKPPSANAKYCDMTCRRNAEKQKNIA